VPVPAFSGQEKMLSPESWQRLTTEFDKSMHTGVAWELEVEMVRPDGRPVWVMARGQPQRNARGEITGLCGVAQDITERKQVESKVQFLAYYDALTGLPNRTLFQDRLNKGLAGARRRGESLAVFFLDLDRFKIINDSFGH